MAEAKARTVYVDEDSGKDEQTQEGTESSPYKSIPFAYLQFKDSAQYQVRKARTGSAPEGADASSTSQWEPAAKAALKKAANYAKEQEKKAGKAKEQALKQQDEDKKRQAVHEEAKKVKVEEDLSLPKAVKIQLDEVNPKVVKLGSATREKEVDYASGERGSRRLRPDAVHPHGGPCKVLRCDHAHFGVNDGYPR